MGAPQWVRTTSGHVYRSLPSALKYGSQFDSFRRDAELGTTHVAQPSVERRLARTLDVALSHVPAYQRYRELLGDQRPVYDKLLELPVTSKLDIKSNLEGFLSRDVSPGRRLKMFTGGSTANPMLFYLEKASSRPKETAYSQQIDRTLMGARPDDWTLSLRGRTVPGALKAEPRLWMHEPIKRHLILSSDHLEPRFMPSYIAALSRFRPRLVHAFPSALVPLSRWLLDHPCPEFTEHVSGVLLTSESVYPFQLDLFRRVFRCPLISHYGHSERVLLATSSGGDDRYHFWPLYGFPELVDGNGNPIVDAGVLGEIVGTSFDNAVMPFVRYRTGDLGMWSETEPALPQRVLQRVEGRLQEFAVCRDHRLVSVTTLGAAHFSDLARVETIQFEQSKAGELVLRVVSKVALSATERKTIERAISDKTQRGCQVSIIEVDRIERTARGKHRMLIQHLPLDRYFGASVPGEVANAPESISQPA